MRGSRAFSGWRWGHCRFQCLIPANSTSTICITTGYAPDVIGEIEISAFELRTGVKTPMVFFLCIAGIALGLLIAPRRTWRAWKRGSGRRNLYGQKWSDVQHWPLSDLRSFTGI